MNENAAAPESLVHPWLYTVVEILHGKFNRVARFRDAVDAVRYLEKLQVRQPESYLLQPSGEMACSS